MTGSNLADALPEALTDRLNAILGEHFTANASVCGHHGGGGSRAAASASIGLRSLVIGRASFAVPGAM